MKRLVLSVMGIFMLLSTAFSQSPGWTEFGVPIELHFFIDKDHSLDGGGPKSPDLIPSVSLDDYTLYFADAFSEVVAIELKDASGTVVYSTNLPIGTQTLVLPATLSGTYTIYIYVGGLCYYGQIIL